MFSFIPQLRKLCRRDTAKSGRKAPPASKKIRTLRLQLEALEDRAVPAIIPPGPPHVLPGSFNIAFTPKFGPETIVKGSTNDGMQNPSVNLVFSGPYWTTAQGQQDEANMLAAVQSILSGPYLTGLTQYGSDGKANFSRSWNDTATVPLQPKIGMPSASALDDFLQNSIDNHPTYIHDIYGHKHVAPPVNTNWQHAPIYVVVSDPNSSAQNPGGWNGGGGYAYIQQGIFKVANIHMIWVGTNGPNRDPIWLDGFTSSLSHELAETISDPDASGITVQPPKQLPWSLSDNTDPQDVTGQIADFEPASQRYGYRLNNYMVQPYWSRQDQAFIVPLGPSGSSYSQNFFLDPVWSGDIFSYSYNLRLQGDQLGPWYNDHIQIGGQRNHTDVAVVMNNASADFLNINKIAVNTGNGANDVQVTELNVPTLNIDSSGISNDTVEIGNNGSLAGIGGTVSVNNNSGQTALTIDNSNDGWDTITITDHSVHYQRDGVTINYQAGFKTKSGTHGVTSLTLSDGFDANQIDVESVGQYTTTVIYGYGDDSLWGPAASKVTFIKKK
jgi:hypothetical protein